MSDDDSQKTTKKFLNKIASFVSGGPKTRTELLELLSTLHDKGVMDVEAMTIIQGALQVSEMQVKEIMVPRAQAIMIQVRSTAPDYLPLIIESAHSRFPVYGDSQDEVLGILLAKDLLALAAHNKLEKTTLKDLIRPASVIPESKRLNVLLREFRQTRSHMAIVINEYGLMSGLVTIEDVLEQIVGEIEDEHDFDDDYFVKKFQDSNVVKATTPIDEFNEHFETEFSDEEFDTIGGIVMTHFGHLPKRNETITIGKYQFKVLNADNRSIRLIQVTEIQ